VSLTGGVATAYATYKTNLAAVEYYRRNILPDQVRYYRGVFVRRKIDPTTAFGDLVQAQQVLVADVTAYLGVLGTLWTSVVDVANFLQTDDLYQLGRPLELPQLPDFDALHPLPCPHAQAPCATAGVEPTPPQVPNGSATTPPAPTVPLALGRWLPKPTAPWAAYVIGHATDSGRSAGDPERRLPIFESTFDASPSLKARKENSAKFPGVLGRPLGTPSSVAALPIEQPIEATAQDLSQRSSAASM
jgi:cobalt-zinc-cadmium efflux system outer membrane protein